VAHARLLRKAIFGLRVAEGDATLAGDLGLGGVVDALQTWQARLKVYQWGRLLDYFRQRDQILDEP